MRLTSARESLSALSPSATYWEEVVESGCLLRLRATYAYLRALVLLRTLGMCLYWCGAMSVLSIEKLLGQ